MFGLQSDIDAAFRGVVCMNALSIPAQHRAFSFGTVAFALATLSNCAQTRLVLSALATLSNCAQTRLVLSALYHSRQLREAHV
jgi:hypothetical protein